MTAILSALGGIVKGIGKGLGIVNKFKPIADLSNWAKGYRVYNNVSNWISGDGTKAVNNAQNTLNRLNNLHH